MSGISLAVASVLLLCHTGSLNEWAWMKLQKKKTNKLHRVKKHLGESHIVPYVNLRLWAR